jgi:hypothetical protein
MDAREGRCELGGGKDQALNSSKKVPALTQGFVRGLCTWSRALTRP